jgi:hypothetical protein
MRYLTQVNTYYIAASAQKHVYVRDMSMFVIIHVRPNSMTVLCFVVNVQFSDIYTAHQQTTTCFKIEFLLFLIFFHGISK